MMSKTYKHSLANKYLKGIIDNIPVGIVKGWKRKNFDKSRFLKMRITAKIKASDYLMVDN